MPCCYYLREPLWSTPGWKCESAIHSVVSYSLRPQASLSIEFSRQEYQTGLPFPSPADLPDPGIELGSLTSQADYLSSEPPDIDNHPNPASACSEKKLFFSSLWHAIFQRKYSLWARQILSRHWTGLGKVGICLQSSISPRWLLISYTVMLMVYWTTKKSVSSITGIWPLQNLNRHFTLVRVTNSLSSLLNVSGLYLQLEGIEYVLKAKH